MSSAARPLPTDLPSEPPRPPAAYSEAFWHAMATLPAHGVPAALAARALKTWWRIASARPPEPEVDLIRADAFRFAWSYDDVYLQLDVVDAGYEWFFRNHNTGDRDGTEEPEAELGPALLARVALVRERHPE